MKTINDVLNNHTIRLYLPSEVLSLPTLNEDVEVNYYPANDLICIRLKNKSSYSEKLIPCNDTDTLIKELRKLAPKKTKANSKNTKAKNENTNAQSGNDDKGENKTCDYSDTPSKSALEAVENNNSETLEATNVGTFTIDPETGEVLELSRDYDGLRRSWKLQCEYAKSSACWRLTRFCTCTVDTKPTYSELNTIVAAFCKWLTRNYTDLLDNCFIFLEPCDDGSWHVHFLIAMIDKPLTFDDEVKIKEWWARKNTKPCDDQVQFAEPFESVDDLLRVLDYLNPTSKKKRHRIKNYPQSCQPMRHIGNVIEPNKALTKFEIAKTILREEKTERRNAIEIEQTNTGVDFVNIT